MVIGNLSRIHYKLLFTDYCELMKILGIDPGVSRIGYGILETEGALSFVDCGVIETIASDQAGKLSELSGKFLALLAQTQPDAAGIETLFFSKNQKTGLAVAEARGVLMLLLHAAGIPTYEYKPREVKLSVCGYGLADKISVAKMVGKTLRIAIPKQHDDATDALAIAITAASNLRFQKKIPAGK